MKIGVTGANGFVGKELVNRGCLPIRSDILNDEELTKEIFESGVEKIIHCAAITSPEECEKDNKQAFEVNVRGTKNVVNACNRNGIHFVYISSDHIFSGKNRPKGGYGIKSLPNPVNYYGFTKFAAEGFTTSFSRKWTVVRTSHLFNAASINAILKPLPFFPHIEVSNVIEKSFVHLTHFVNGLIDASHYYNKIINVAGSEILTEYTLLTESCVGLNPPSAFIVSRNYLLEDFDASVVLRPVHGGLNVSKSKELGISIYSYRDGFELLRNGV